MSDPAALRSTLASLYEGVFTAVVRVQSGSQSVQRADSFRAKMRDVLRDIGRTAVQRGFEPEYVNDAHFAVVAMLDEAILTSEDPAKQDWAKSTLAEEMYQLRSAGEVFFERIERLRSNRDSPQLAQVLEIYYLCLLLGYEGRYAVGNKADLKLLMDNLRERIDRVSAQTPGFSPDAALPPVEPSPAPLEDPLPAKLRVAAIAALSAAAIIFLLAQIHLHWMTGTLSDIAGKVGNR